jgi:EAL domain-containing protein (putative c-di-GMP-specific phosphodiesterase class I)
MNTLIKWQQFNHVYQPIYNLSNWNKCGYEALIRCHSYQNPEHLFREARKGKLVYQLDTESIYKAIIDSVANIKQNGLLLFLNIFRSTLIHPHFSSFVDRLINEFPISRQHIVFEINEIEEDLEIEVFRQAVSTLKKQGFLIALDDVGRGASSLQMITELELDFIKLDRFFSVDLSNSEKKQRMVQFFVEYCQNDVQLILEGLEEPEDLAAAQTLGVTKGQGYILGKPANLGDIFHKKETS